MIILVHMNYFTSQKSARAIRVILADRRQTIESLSVGSGISLSTLKRRLYGESPFTIDEMVMIADFWAVSLTEIMTPLSDRILVAVGDSK